MQKKLVIVVGPTGVGKSSLAIQMAKKFNGEIVSADSRQVYKYMDLGTGKVTQEEQKGTPHHLIDIITPDKEFSAFDFKSLAVPVIKGIWEKEKVPIIVGGTGFYVKALISDMESLGVPVNKKLRKELESKSLAELQEILKKKSIDKFSKTDVNNPRRLVRAIEIASAKEIREVPRLNFDEVLIIGLTASKELLYKRSDLRIEEMVKAGLVEEIKNLLKMGYGWNLPSMSSVWYLPFKDYFEKKRSLEEVVQKVKFETHAYIRRQIIWFKKQKDILWFDIREKDYKKEAEKRVVFFLNG